MSTAYHPQTDGQTERLNQMLEQYLRCYLNYQQDNWVTLLPLAQFAYNSAKQETTQVSPFFANYSFEPELYRQQLLDTVLAQKAHITVEQLKALHQQLSRDIAFIALRTAKYYNKKREDAPALKRGDKVYLLRRNIKTTRPSDKLDYVKIGPFKIQEQTGKVNY